MSPKGSLKPLCKRTEVRSMALYGEEADESFGASASSTRLGGSKPSEHWGLRV